MMQKVWRRPTEAELQRITQGRKPIVLIGSTIIGFLALLPMIFGIVNGIDLIKGGEISDAIGLVVDALLFAAILIARAKFVKLMNSDVDEKSLIACDGIVRSIGERQYSGRKDFERFSTQEILAWDVEVCAREDVSAIYHVRVNKDTGVTYHVGEKVVLFANREDMAEKNMFLLQVDKER